jgi:hypothetical protein
MDRSPLEELAVALRRLHRSAGEPSTHVIGRKINYSHTTVAVALRMARCPTWPVLRAVVTFLDGDLEEFRSYWIAARDAEDPLLGSHAPSGHGHDVAQVTDDEDRSNVAQVTDDEDRSAPGGWSPYTKVVRAGNGSKRGIGVLYVFSAPRALCPYIQRAVVEIVGGTVTMPGSPSPSPQDHCVPSSFGAGYQVQRACSRPSWLGGSG